MKRTYPKINNILIYFLLIIFCGWSIFPIAWVISSSFKTEAEMFTTPPTIIPLKFSLKNYIFIFFGEFSIAPYFLNSVVVSLCATVIAFPLGCFAAYSFSRSRFRFRGSHTLFFVFLLGRMIPPVALAIPIYIFMWNLGLVNTVKGLILIYAAFQLPFVIWMMRSYFIDIPEDLEDAALVDGCSRLTAFLRIVLPLAKAGLATTSMFTWTLSWNEFIFAVFLTTTPATQTMSLYIGAATATMAYRHIAGAMCAATILYVVPVIILSILVQKHIVRGFTVGALKG